MRDHVAEALLATLVVNNGGELVIDARGVNLKDYRLVMVPMVERRAYKVLMLPKRDDVQPL